MEKLNEKLRHLSLETADQVKDGGWKSDHGGFNGSLYDNRRKGQDVKRIWMAEYEDVCLFLDPTNEG